MKRLFLIVVVMALLGGCSENIPENEIANNLIVPDTESIETRIAAPEGYSRLPAEEGSITAFLRDYKLKAHGEPVLLYNGKEKANQSAHIAVFEFPLENENLQQCADSVMRVFAEYLWQSGQKEKIAFHFTDGFLCEYTRWREGYRIITDKNGTRWAMSASYDESYECFIKYLRMVFSYAGTASMEAYETEKINLSELAVGDVILKGGSPGHIVMVADVCENADGEKAYLLAQGYMPAQEFHIITNPAHKNDPWYYEKELVFPLKTAEYTFESEDMLRRPKYLE